MRRLLEWTIGAIISILFVGIMAIMITIFSPKLAQEAMEENDNLFV